MKLLGSLLKEKSKLITPKSLQCGFVHDFADFQLSIIFHRLRLSLLARYLVEHYPNSFSNLEPETVDVFFRKYHDRGKDYFSRELFSFYGKNLHDLEQEHAQNRISEVTGALNRLDEIITNKFLIKAKLKIGNQLTAAGKSLLHLEDIVDKVDRGMYIGSQEEFNKAMLPATDLLKRAEDKFFARILENNYQTITKKYWMKKK